MRGYRHRTRLYLRQPCGPYDREQARRRRHHAAGAATTRGLWRYQLDASNRPVAGRTWTNVFMPNPTADSNISQPYKNIVNDVAIDDAGGVLANAAWRSGHATYNGFYDSRTGATETFTQVNPQGALGYQQVGNTEFAWGTDTAGKKTVLYAAVEFFSPPARR